MIMINSSAEEYHPRWGARTSNPVKSVNDRLGGFDSCLFRNLSIENKSVPFIPLFRGHIVGPIKKCQSSILN